MGLVSIIHLVSCSVVSMVPPSISGFLMSRSPVIGDTAVTSSVAGGMSPVTGGSCVIYASVDTSCSNTCSCCESECVMWAVEEAVCIDYSIGSYNWWVPVESGVVVADHRYCYGPLAGSSSSDSDCPKMTNDISGYVVGDEVSCVPGWSSKVLSCGLDARGCAGGEEPVAASLYIMVE